jgi:uroporphyrinogen-III synthase
MRKLLLLRPEPGLSASAERARAMGLEVIVCPLFRVEPVEWSVPDPANHDALLLTSANAARLSGRGLEALKSLPVLAVGEATAAAARKHGLRVERVGTGGVDDLLAELPGPRRLLHLAGQDRLETAATEHHAATRVVYRSVAIETPDMPSLEGLVAAVHSPRAGQRLADLATARNRTAVAAISAAAALACGEGWERIEVAERPDDASLLVLAATLCHTSPPA